MLEEGTPPVFSPWFRTYPERFREEREALEAMGFILDEKCFRESEVVSFSGSLRDYPERRLTITFPLVYPSIHPSVVDDGNCQFLPRHQQPATRSYCLYGPHGEDWYAGNDRDGVHALGEVKKLLDYVLGGEMESADPKDDPYPEPFSLQAIFGDFGTILVPPGISDLRPVDLTQVTEGRFTLDYDTASKPIFARGVVLNAEFKDGSQSEALQGYRKIVGGKKFTGKLIYLPSLSSPILNGDDFYSVLEKFGVSQQIGYPWCALIFPEQSGDAANFSYSWLLFKQEQNKRFTPAKTITFQSSGREARIPGLGFLPSKKIAIIGCGSIGSKIAASLASSGVQGFVLIDMDTMEPANSIRHECGVNYFGFPKTHSLLQRIVALNPDAEGHCQAMMCNPFRVSVPEDRDQIFQAISDCDLIVDATGNQCLARAICEIARGFLIPVVRVSVSNGAWTGEIFRYIPGKSNCWQCFQNAFNAPIPGAEVPNGHVFGPGCDQPTFTGAGYELGMVASLATAFIVDTLGYGEGVPSEYDGDYLLWRGRNAEGRLVQAAEIYKVPARPYCPFCKSEDEN